MIRKLLIANRGEIAVRIMRTARRLGIVTVAVYSDADRSAMHVALADEAIRIGPPPAAQSYLDQKAIIAGALRCGAEAIHPGYGFLSENPDFAEAVAKAGLTFVGPPAAAIRAMGLKSEAKRLMHKAKVPLLPGYHGANQEFVDLAAEAERIGYPVLIKPVAGGGGKGMRRVANASELAGHLEAAKREAVSAFGDGRLLLEKYLDRARHIEVQIMADAHGNVVHLFERDCSLQRRHQKVIEESPAPGMTPAMRERLCSAAIAAARSVGYAGAGTVEFIADASDGLRPDRFYFMEMNTRLQVEHPVTEMVTGLDLVELQLRVAAGEPLPLRQEDITLSGHAVEARLYAEDPGRDFQPQTGRIDHLFLPEEPWLRADLGVRAGDIVTPYYDPMLGKLIVTAPSRGEAFGRLARVLSRSQVTGCQTNIAFLSRLAQHPDVVSGLVDTMLIARGGGYLQAASDPAIEAVAGALLFACGYLEAPRGPSPFDSLIGFRLWGDEHWQLEFQFSGRPIKCSLERKNGGFVASCGTQVFQFRILDSDQNCVRLDCGNRILRLSWFQSDGIISITFGDRRFEFGLSRIMEHADEISGGDVVMSPTPGVVRKICVSVGDKIERGTTVAIIESMKMEFSLKAERGGHVKAIHATEGTQISEGTILAELGDDDG